MSARLVHRIWVACIAIVTIAAIVFVVGRIPRTISIFVLASIVALGVYPVTSRLERYMPRWGAIALVFGVLTAAIVTMAFLIVPATFSQIQALIVNAPDFTHLFRIWFKRIEDILSARFGDVLVVGAFTQIQAQLAAKTQDFMTLLVASVGAIVLDTANAFFVAISALILSFFLLAQGKGIANGVISLLPPSRRERGNALLHEIAHIFGSFVAGEAIVCSIVGIACWVCLLPMHFQFALLAGLLCGLGYAIPYVGMIVAQLIAAVLAIPQGGGMVLWVSVVIFVIARIADSVISPKVMADAVGVSPIGVMFASFAGGEAFGLPGLLLGIPAAALIKVLFEYFVAPLIVRAQMSDEEHAQHMRVTIEVDESPMMEEAVVTSTQAS
ncbi:MAG TPA: AI-2E family transporter [Candidatus Binatia bacterium]|nr:AI-2E family transporter [Candidatus Binatia bacterium]